MRARARSRTCTHDTRESHVREGGRSASMAERELSRRSQRRMRAVVAQRLAGQLPKKPRLVMEVPEDSRREDHEDTSLSHCDPSRSHQDMSSPEDAPLSPPEGPEHASLSPSEVPEHTEHASLSPSAGPEHAPLSSPEELIGSSSETGSFDGVGDMGEDCDSMSASLSDESLTDTDLSESECATAEPKTFDSSVPLYPESSITDVDFNTVFLSFAQRHNLTYSSQSDLLKLLSLLLPSPSRIPSSSSVLIGKYVNLKEDAIIQHYCGVCSNPIDCGSSCGQQQCAKAQLPRAVFIRVPLSMQLKERFEGKITVQLLNS